MPTQILLYDNVVGVWTSRSYLRVLSQVFQVHSFCTLLTGYVKKTYCSTRWPHFVNWRPRDEVDLGSGYNDQAWATFISNMAKEQRDQFRSVLENVQFFSIQANGSTNAGIVEDDLFTVLYLDCSVSDGKVHVRSKLFVVRQTKSGDAEDVLNLPWVMLISLIGRTNWLDLAGVNIAAGGLWGHLEESVPWDVVIWYLTHQLELSFKDAIKGTLFSSIDDMLLRHIICTTNHSRNVVSWTKWLLHFSYVWKAMKCQVQAQEEIGLYELVEHNL